MSDRRAHSWQCKMKTTTMLVLFLAALAPLGLAARPPLCIVREGRATSTIVIPDGADSWTRQAAKWLTEYVKEATGAELNVVAESKAPAGTLVSIGHTQLAKRAGITVDDLKWDGYRMVVTANVLYLIGRDEEPIDKERTLAAQLSARRGWGVYSMGMGARGTLRAAIAFLEEFCGVRWFLPTPEGELVPETRDVLVPRELDRTFVPAFAYADGRFPYGHESAACFANNYRLATKVIGWTHSYHDFLPAEKHFKEHPEYFALTRLPSVGQIGGKRTGKGHHLCSTNPDVRGVLLRAIRERFDQGYDWVQLGQEDGYRRCQCPACERVDNYRPGPHLWEPGGGEYTYTTLRQNPCERLLLLHKWIVDECRASHPDKTVRLLVYIPTLWPSRKFDRFGDNVVAQMCILDPRVIEAWRGKVRALSAYLYWGDLTAPMGMDVHATPREIADKIRFLRDNGFVGITQFWEGNWGLQGPLIYELGKLMGDPDLDYRALIEEYCLGVYGENAGKTMLRFFDLLYARHANVLPPLSAWCRRDPPPECKSISDLYALLYPPRFTQKLDRLLRQAEAEAKTERAKGWLRLTRDHFDFSRFLGGMLVSYAEYQENPTDGKLREVKAWVDQFEELRERIVNYDDEYVSRWFPAHGKFCCYLTSDGGGEFESYYADWKKRKREVLQKGLRGTAIGYRIGAFGRVIAEPITLFNKAEGRRRNAQ